MGRNLIDRFCFSAEKLPDHVALEVDGGAFTYEGLRQGVAKIAATLRQNSSRDEDLTGVLAHRSLSAYAGILGVLFGGRGYVPLNPRFPVERTRRMFEAAELSTLIVGKEALAQLAELLPAMTRRLTVLGPEISDFNELAAKFRQHRFIPSTEIKEAEAAPTSRKPRVDDIAYLMFTSGSTGTPKGVPVSHDNVAAYLDHIRERYAIGPEDRVSQMFDLTFDLSVHDLFATWGGGGTLCVVPERSVMAPASFITRQDLTVWFSVPSVVMMMRRLRMLGPNSFPKLRLALFCGEALPVQSIEAWAAAAPNAHIENIYGPTEATIAITGFEWRGNDSSTMCRRGVVPIGEPFPGQKVLILDESGSPVPSAGRGELLLGGSQVTCGYWRMPEVTTERYIQVAGTGEGIWYRTGDLVERDEAGILHFVGRLDSQIKLGGYRIELLDVDQALREATGSDLVVSVAWPIGETGPQGIVGCVEAELEMSDQEIRDRCKSLLPPYMVPSGIHRVERMPLNANGKIDRGELRKELDRLNPATENVVRFEV